MTALGSWFISALEELGGVTRFFILILRTAFRTRGNLSRTCEQIVSVTLRSLPTVMFAGLFVGAILVLQYNLVLERYDAQSLLGGLNTSSVLREIGPLIISFLLAGKIGAYTAAELGTMRVTEQIDAIECLGTNPIQYLIVPRFVGIVISSVLLLILGLMVSIGGSMWVAQTLCGINMLQYATSIPQFTDGTTIAGGMFKSLCYGTIVGLVSCYKGYTATGGARGVGRAVTMAAVLTNFYIIIANFFSSMAIDIATETIRLIGEKFR